MPQLNKFEIEMFAKRAAQDLLEHGRELNESIMEIAGVNDLSREQVRRVVEATNTIANGEMVKRAKVTGGDPRISFKLADSNAVFAMMIGETPQAKLAEMKKVAQLGAMFVVPDSKPAIEKVASKPEPRLSAMSGPELAAAYVRGLDVSDQAFTLGQLADAVDDVARVADTVREKWAQLALLEEDVLGRFAAAVEAELHAGLSPATIKAAMARAPVLDAHMAAGVAIVDARAREMGRGEGVSKIAAETIVDERSPVIEALCSMLLIDAERDVVLGIGEKVAGAHERATADLNTARAAGSAKLAVNLGTAARASQGVGKVVSGVSSGLGNAAKVVGIGMGAVEAKNRASESTKRLKGMQGTPAVGPMKMAQEKLARQMEMFGRTLSDTLRPSRLVGIAASAAIAGGALMATEKLFDTVGGGVNGVFERRRRDKLFEALLARDPQLKTNARAREYFDLVLTYAPALGDHPTAIGDFLKRQLQYPVSGVEFLSALTKLQKDVSDSRRRSPNALTAGIGNAVTNAQSQWMKDV